MLTGKFASVIGGAVVLGLAMTSSGGATPMAVDQQHHLTFSGAVGLPGVTLPGGTYTFELIPLHPNIVRVRSRDGSRQYFTGFTRQVARPAGLGTDGWVTFNETRRDVPPRIKVWYPDGMSGGQEFVYPATQR